MKFFYASVFTLFICLNIVNLSTATAQDGTPQGGCFAFSSQQNVTCNGQCNGSATITFVGGGGFGTHAYSWNTVPVQTTATATNLCAGTYTCTITTSNGCVTTEQVTITQPAGITITITKEDATCYGGTDGSATANVTGGSGNITYSWNTTPVQTTQTATNLTAGTYTVTVTRNGCSKTATVTINQGPQITGSISTTPATCGLADGTATASPQGGYGGFTYSWNTTPVQTTQTATGLSVGTYIVTVTDAEGCTQSGPAQVGSVGGPTITVTETPVTCNGGTNGTATATPSGGVGPYTYAWDTDPVQTTQTATGLEVGTYTVYVTDAQGCNGEATVTVTQSNSITVTATYTDPLCFGSANGTASATASGGTTPYWFQWNTNPVTYSANATGLLAGTYTVTATDNFGCTATATVTLVQPALMQTNITFENLSCNSANDGSATANVTGGTQPYAFDWSTIPDQATQTAVNLAAGSYSVLVTDSNGCVSTAGVTITQPPAITLSVSSTNTPCGQQNGTATATASGGEGTLAYSWNTNPVQTIATATNLPAGTYTVTVTDDNDCSVTATATVVSPGGPSSTVSHTNVSCNGGNNGTATVTPSGGTQPYTYLWSPGGATTQTAFGLTAGTYTATVTDQSGCTTVSTVTINQPAAIAITLDATDIACFGETSGAINSTIEGGVTPYTYSWNTTPEQTTSAISNLVAGDYTLTVTDANGCTADETATVAEPAELTASTVQTHVSCNAGNNGSGTANAVGGTQPYTYSWNTNPEQTTETAINLEAGTYDVTITDANGCSVVESVTITEPEFLNVASSATPEDCGQSNGTATATVTGGTGNYTYSWNTNPVQTTASATGLLSGTYTVTVTDENACSATSIINVPNAGGLNAEANGTNVSCFGGNNGTASLGVSGGTQPYSFSWNTNPVQTTQSITGLTAGTYTATVTDNLGCEFTATVTITEPAEFTVNATHENILCNGQLTGTATANPTGGTTPYTYAWDTQPAQTTASISGLAAGVYTVLVTDANGCEASATSNITQPASPLTATTLQTHVSCNGGSNGATTANPVGGTAPYSYSWNTVPAQTTQTAFGLTSGTYTVVITDANGCSVSKNATINQPTAITSTVAVDDATCGQTDGEVTVTPSGGTGSYTYSWNTSPVQTSATATGLAAGVYTVTITDANNCTTTASATVNNTGAADLSISETNVSCFEGNNGTATVIATGGTGNLTYSWNTTPEQTTASATGLEAGTYTVTVTDQSGCESFESATITEPTELTVSASGTDPSCIGCADGSITASTSGGVAPYTYSFNGTPVPSTVTGVPAGTYCFDVTDNNGCTTQACVTLTDPPVGIAEEENPISLNVYPNPVYELFTIEMELGKETEVNISLYTLTGNLVFANSREANGNYKENIDISNLAAGMYILNVQAQGENMVRRMVKR
ncbi:MAG: T9SS type A sorting domain-containing protein [Bacteroidia bacterium]